MSESLITKKALAEAMKELMAEKPMERIGIGEIVSRCGLNRKSFYYHFRDKYQLVNWIFYTEAFAKIEERQSDDPWDTLLTICEYLYENKRFYCNAFGVTGEECFSGWLTEVLRRLIGKYFDVAFEGGENKEFYATYCADATRAALQRWLMEDTATPPDRFVSLMRIAAKTIAKKIMSEEIDGGHNA